MISQEFLKFFSEFVSHYKKNASPTFYSWNNEANYEALNGFLHELFVVVESNQEIFDDANIIRCLNDTALKCSRSDPYFLKLWAATLEQYNTLLPTDKYQVGNIYIEDGGENKPLERMIRDLKQALITAQNEIALLKKSHLAEMGHLNAQIDVLTKKIAELTHENHKLRDLVHFSQMIKASPSQESPQAYLLEMVQLFGKLLLPNNEIAPEPELPSTPKAQVAPPPPPPPLQNRIPSVKINVAKPEEKPEQERPLSSIKATPVFFPAPSNGELIDGINEALKKMQEKKMNREQLPQTEEEKKKSSKPPITNGPELLVQLMKRLEARRVVIEESSSEDEEDAFAPHPVAKKENRPA